MRHSIVYLSRICIPQHGRKGLQGPLSTSLEGDFDRRIEFIRPSGVAKDGVSLESKEKATYPNEDSQPPSAGDEAEVWNLLRSAMAHEAQGS